MAPDATASKNKSKRDPDYMEIWWDAFVYDFGTTFGTPGEAQMFWKDKILAVIKNNMESLGIQDANLMNKFKTNTTVMTQMKTDSRVPPPYTVSALEQITERYGVGIEGAKVGTATTYESRSNINLIPKSKFTGKGLDRKVDIKFQVSYLGHALKEYPSSKSFTFKYSLADEN